MTNQQQQKTQIGNSSNPVLRDNIVLPLYFYLMEHRAMADFESAQLDGRRAHINHNSLRQILQYEKGSPFGRNYADIYASAWQELRSSAEFFDAYTDIVQKSAESLCELMGIGPESNEYQRIIGKLKLQYDYLNLIV